MPKPPESRRSLIEAAWHDDWANGPAAEFARRAAASARRRRRVRQVSLVGGIVIALVISGFAPRLLSPSRTPEPALVAANPGYELISEDQLMAALAGRAVLILPDEPGGKRIILLNR